MTIDSETTNKTKQASPGFSIVQNARSHEKGGKPVGRSLRHI